MILLSSPATHNQRYLTMPKQSVFDPCPYCQSKRLVKTSGPAGPHKRYLCRACGRDFTPYGVERSRQKARAIERLQQGALHHKIQRETGLKAEYIKKLQDPYVPHLPLPSSGLQHARQWTCSTFPSNPSRIWYSVAGSKDTGNTNISGSRCNRSNGISRSLMESDYQ